MLQILQRSLFFLVALVVCIAPIHACAAAGTMIAQSDEESMIPDVSLLTPPPDQYFRAKVLTLTESPFVPPKQLFGDLVDGVDKNLVQDADSIAKRPVQTLSVTIVGGTDNGKEVTITQGGPAPIAANQNVKPGDDIVIVKTGPTDQAEYYVVDFYRLPSLGLIFALFLVLVLIFGRRKGLGAILGMAFSILILAKGIVPAILAGHNPLIVTLLGSLAIVFISLYLAHGFNRRTTVALGSTLLTLGIAVCMATAFVALAKLFGTGSEDALTLQFGTLEHINLKGLLLSGMIIGTLGVLDDITTAQTAVVEELHHANPSLSNQELYRRSLSVGKEHIASLVNTLVLAYAGAALPLFLLFQMNSHNPFWLTLNSGAIAEEIVRTLVGSTALILAVPLATLLAVMFIPKVRRDGRDGI